MFPCTHILYSIIAGSNSNIKTNPPNKAPLYAQSFKASFGSTPIRDIPRPSLEYYYHLPFLLHHNIKLQIKA